MHATTRCSTLLSRSVSLRLALLLRMPRAHSAHDVLTPCNCGTVAENSAPLCRRRTQYSLQLELHLSKRQLFWCSRLCQRFQQCRKIAVDCQRHCCRELRPKHPRSEKARGRDREGRKGTGWHRLEVGIFFRMSSGCHSVRCTSSDR